MGNISFAVKTIIFNDGKFLAVHKSTIQSPKYELPGGRMNFGETAEETVNREIYEETGLHITPLKLLDTWNYISVTEQIMGIIYLCMADKLDNTVLSDEHDQYKRLETDSQSLEVMNRLFKPQILKCDWKELIKDTNTTAL